jgi:hypothetical protein
MEVRGLLQASKSGRWLQAENKVRVEGGRKGMMLQQVWIMTDDEYFVQMAIKGIFLLIIVIIGIIAFVKEKKK